MSERAGRKGAAGVAIAATIGNMVGITPAISATFGVFLIPIASDFHWPRAWVSGVLGLISLVSAFIYPVVGRMMDRYGPRRMLIAGNLAFAATVALLATSTPNVYQFYFLFALVGIAGCVPSTAMFCKVVSNWFDEKRGLMLGVTAGVGNGVGSTALPILAGLLLTALGWRMSFAAIGAIVALVGFPTLMLLLRDAPAARAGTADVPAELLEGLSLSQAVRTHVFWLMLLAIAAGAGGMMAVFTHVVPMLTDRGFALSAATGVVALFAMVAAGWQVVTGFMLDKLRSPRVIVPMYASAIMGLLLLEFGQGTPTIMLAGVLLGIGLGAEFGALPYFISRYFGLRCYGSITGVLYAVVILLQGVAPALMDFSYDNLHDYVLASLIIVGALGCGIVLLAMLPKLDMLAPTDEGQEGLVLA
jgi:MFS family permease